MSVKYWMTDNVIMPNSVAHVHMQTNYDLTLPLRKQSHTVYHFQKWRNHFKKPQIIPKSCTSKIPR